MANYNNPNLGGLQQQTPVNFMSQQTPVQFPYGNNNMLLSNTPYDNYMGRMNGSQNLLSNQFLKCRPVSSKDEARAYQIDLDGTPNRFARYKVTLQGNIQIPEGGAVTPIALGITLNGVVIPESVAIVTPAAAEDYWHVNTSASITVPCGCCVTVSGAYVDGTEDDPTTTPTPSIQVRREASLDVKRTA